MHSDSAFYDKAVIARLALVAALSDAADAISAVYEILEYNVHYKESTRIALAKRALDYHLGVISPFAVGSVYKHIAEDIYITVVQIQGHLVTCKDLIGCEHPDRGIYSTAIIPNKDDNGYINIEKAHFKLCWDPTI